MESKKRSKAVADRRFAKKVAKEKYGVDIPDFLEFAPSTLWIVEDVTRSQRLFHGFETRPKAQSFVDCANDGWGAARIVGRYVWYVAEDEAPKKGKKR